MHWDGNSIISSHFFMIMCHFSTLQSISTKEVHPPQPMVQINITLVTLFKKRLWFLLKYVAPYLNMVGKFGKFTLLEHLVKNSLMN